jgi:hypothetical protein
MFIYIYLRILYYVSYEIYDNLHKEYLKKLCTMNISYYKMNY